jgi:hypothetical protein
MGLESFEKLKTWGRGPLQRALIGRGFDLGKFPGAIIRHQFGPPVLAALPRSDVTTAYFGLRIGIQGRRVRRSFKLHALQWLFDDVRP